MIILPFLSKLYKFCLKHFSYNVKFQKKDLVTLIKTSSVYIIYKYRDICNIQYIYIQYYTQYTIYYIQYYTQYLYTILYTIYFYFLHIIYSCFVRVEIIVNFINI